MLVYPDTQENLHPNDIKDYLDILIKLPSEFVFKLFLGFNYPFGVDEYVNALRNEFRFRQVKMIIAALIIYALSLLASIQFPSTGINIVLLLVVVSLFVKSILDVLKFSKFEQELNYFKSEIRKLKEQIEYSEVTRITIDGKVVGYAFIIKEKDKSPIVFVYVLDKHFEDVIKEQLKKLYPNAHIFKISK